MGNELSERFNHTLLSMVGTLTSEKKKVWPKYLPDLVMAYNSSTHDSTGYSPYFLMFCRQPRLPVDMVMGITLKDDNDVMMTLIKINRRCSEQHMILCHQHYFNWICHG